MADEPTSSLADEAKAAAMEIRFDSGQFVRCYEREDKAIWSKADKHGRDLTRENSEGVLYHVRSVFVPHGCTNPLEALRTTEAQPACECGTCGGCEWVCEDHTDRPWSGASKRSDACTCGGAGAPCPKCNPLSHPTHADEARSPDHSLRALRRCSEEEGDEISLSVFDWPDGRTLTQHREFMWGDHLLILCELNRSNVWDDLGFDAATTALERALSHPTPADEARGLIQRIVGLGKCESVEAREAALVDLECDAAEWLAGKPADDALHPATADLVDRFAAALKEKLAASERKYGWTDEWTKDDWQERCQRSLVEHLAKGDPRDVAAFAAFMWHHGWPTVAADDARTPAEGA
tara:strand:- start:82 stop:1134 length:1053 start_codon:yes stop_codon:yes gene_type:complete